MGGAVRVRVGQRDRATVRVTFESPVRPAHTASLRQAGLRLVVELAAAGRRATTAAVSPPASAGPAEKRQERRYSVTARKTPLYVILFSLSKLSGLLITAEPSVAHAQVSVDLHNVSLEEILDAATRPAGLRWSRQGDVILVHR
jgi:hypothetical protein